MKKTLRIALFLCLVALQATAPAVVTTMVTYPDFTLTANDYGDGWIGLSYEGTAASIPVAMALRVSVSDGITVNPFDVFTDPVFGVYPDSYYTGPGIVFPGPLAFADMPGQLMAPASIFAVSLAAFAPYTAPGSPYDLNGDTRVDQADLLLFTIDWMSMGSSPSDFNGDLLVDMKDLGLMNNGAFLPPTATEFVRFYLPGYNPAHHLVLIEEDMLRGGIVLIPEPATLLVLSFGILAIRRKRNA